MIRILHLSDLHFGDGHMFRQIDVNSGASTLTDAIVEVLDSEALLQGVTHVVISGDTLTIEAATEALLAEQELRNLLTQLRVPTSNCLIVPGNHDLSWDPRFKAMPFRAYDGMLRNLQISTLATDNLPTLVTLTDPGGVPAARVLLLNSCKMEGKETAGLGFFSPAQLTAARKLVDKASGDKSLPLIAVFHHHVLPVVAIDLVDANQDMHKKPTRLPSLTLDAVDALRQLSEMGVAAVLHGHQHLRNIVMYENVLENGRPIYVIGAGSVSASEAGLQRHFFVHDLDGELMRCHSFTQSPRDQRRFDREHATHDIPLSRVQPSGGDVCPTEAAHRARAPVMIEQPSHDNSDLWYYLMTVSNCVESRAIVRQFFESLQTPGALQDEVQASSLRLDGMYDLLGKWDLLVRFRISQGANERKLMKSLDDALVKGRMMPERSKRRGSEFGEFKSINVYQEHSDVTMIATRGSAKTALHRLVLGGTDEYENARCQRGFIVIQVPPRNGDWFIDELSGAIAPFGLPGIIESVSICDGFVVLELFTRCSQSVEVNRLNRAIEVCLAGRDLQKYTLLCYGCEENVH